MCSATNHLNATLSQAITHPLRADFTWIEGYISNPLSSRLDLRLRKKPLHARLSPAVAGLGDDASDIPTVRRDWIEKTAAKEAASGKIKHLKYAIVLKSLVSRFMFYRIRLGTFNVNGKSPSQDLHSWLCRSESEGPPKIGWISPLKLSPFEVSSDPFHHGSLC